MSNTNVEFNDRTFSFDLQKWADDFNVDVSNLTRAFAARIFENIVRATPVGNPSLWKNDNAPKGYVGGNARNNWMASLNTTVEKYSQRPGTDSSSVLSEVSAAISQGKAGDIFYLQNSAPYIWRLEHGWSTQAPEGMIAKTLAAAEVFYNQSKQEALR